MASSNFLAVSMVFVGFGDLGALDPRQCLLIGLCLQITEEASAFSGPQRR